MAALAEDREDHILRVAKGDVERAMALVTEDKVIKAELVQALHFLCHSAKAAVDVAECRGERLDSLE
ncbi:hypothetical protein [Streptomyces sp. H51]|uniref:hypothetical protein n=1 Tax=Streptomyces sp. H51 TaxID=3111770 RepID=UPI002D767A97|nr:hypothetical protein [Streptomyces sp. H51]